MDFLKDDGLVSPSVFDVTPRDIVAFLQSLDAGKGGQTIVHDDECPHWGIVKSSPCACPRRMAFNTLRKYRYQLQGHFRDNGLSSPWSPHSENGNPCNSVLVKRYLDMIALEQAAGGVVTVQAALVDSSVFTSVVQATLRCWLAEKERDPVAAVEALRDALYYSLLWNSGLRAGDALRLNVAQVTLFEPSKSSPVGGAYIDVTKAKAQINVLNPHRITIFDDGTPYAFNKLWLLYDTYVSEHGLFAGVPAGPLFRKFLRDSDGNAMPGPRVPWFEMDRRYKSLTAELHWTPNVLRLLTLHSFHGSRAAREKAAGVPREETCTNMRWSIEMYEYYTSGREPLTVDGITLARTPDLVGDDDAPCEPDDASLD